jgi:hypothetical protein
MGGVQRLVLYSIEDIQPGQHILYQYGPNYSSNSNEIINISDLKYENGLDIIPPEDQEDQETPTKMPEDKKTDENEEDQEKEEEETEEEYPVEIESEADD